MSVGCVAAICMTPDYETTQAWSRYFYENTIEFPELDGLFYHNAHNEKEAVALYERCQNDLVCPAGESMRLDGDLNLITDIQMIAEKYNLIIL